MWKLLAKSLTTGLVTTAYPDARTDPPEAFRGLPEVRGTSAPASADDGGYGGRPRFAALPDPACCPSGAIEVRPGSDGGPRTWRLDIARCVFCGRCAEAAADDAVRITRGFELAARKRDDLVIEVAEEERSPGAAAPPLPAPAAAPGPDAREALGERLRSTIERVLGRSLHLRHLDAGSCNACDWELSALLNPVYDVQRLGIDFVASPRHADGVIVTGPVTRNLEIAVRRTFEAIPEPRVVIAVGACACSGGIVGAGYASAGGVAAVLPVDVHIPGCPPRPEAIIFGILLAMGRVAQTVAARRVAARA